MSRHIVSMVALLLWIAISGCNGTTGDQLVTFSAYAAGANGVGDPFTVNGYTIQLTYAHVYVGAIYVNEAPAGSGGTFNTPACISQGVYCAQVPDGLDVDLLSTERQPFPVQGSGSADPGLSWELYLTQGDVNTTVAVFRSCDGAFGRAGSTGIWEAIGRANGRPRAET